MKKNRTKDINLGKTGCKLKNERAFLYMKRIRIRSLRTHIRKLSFKYKSNGKEVFLGRTESFL